MTTTYYKGKIGQEDIEFGTGTFLRKDQSGANRALTQINAEHIPFDSQDKYLEDLIDAGYDVDIYPRNIIPKSSANATMTGNETFVNTDGHIFWRDPGGTNRNFNPSGSFIRGFWVIVINTADAAENIVFDSAGIAIVIGQDKRADFIYNGTTWTIINLYNPTVSTPIQRKFSRSQFGYASVTTININGGTYNLQGTVYDVVYWDAQIVFVAGSGGSNADSSDLNASDIHYLYIDDSSITITDELVAANFVNSTTAPTWDNAKKGYYNGLDLCIFAFITDGANQIVEFFHDGSDLVTYATYVTISNEITPSTTWTDSNCASAIPAFSIRGLLTFGLQYVNADATAGVRRNGQTAATGHAIGTVASTEIWATNTFPVYLSTAQIIETQWSAVTTNKVSVYVDGWYLPIGM